MDCKRVRNLMAEYIGQELDNNTKEEVDCHIDECDTCFNEAKKLDKVIWTLECDSRAVKSTPFFLDNMEEKVLSNIKPHIKIRIPKKVLRIMTVGVITAAFIFAFKLFAPINFKYKVYAAATFGKVYSTDGGTFGKKISVSSTSNNVKVTATKISADDMGTIIHFKVEGKNGIYCFDPNSIFIREKLNLGKFQNSILSYRLMQDSQGFIFQLSPVEDGTKVLHLSFSRLNHFISGQTGADPISGQWSFAIPVEKAKSLSYPLNKDIKVDNYDIMFKSLTVGPTGSYLEYEYQNKGLQNSFGGFDNGEIICGKKVCQPLMSISTNQNSYIVGFESIYPDYPGKIAINIKSYSEFAIYRKPIEIPVSISGKFPMEFKFDGYPITLTNFKNKGGTIQFDMIEPDGQRNYGHLSESFEDSDGSILTASAVPEKYYVFDDNGTQYNYDDLIKNPTKYINKHFYGYPVDTAYSFKLKNPDSKYFNIEIYSSYRVICCNKKITLR